MTTSQEYFKTVEFLATSIKDEWKQDNDLEVFERIHELIEGNHYVIYYSANIEVLQASNNEDAFEDQGGELDTSKGWRSILTQVAYFAMWQDVMDKLEELGFDGEGFEEKDN